MARGRDIEREAGRTLSGKSNLKKNARGTTIARPLTAKQRREVAALAQRPDGEIDYSDIPPLEDKFWRDAVRNPFYRPVKRQLTVRLDVDVLVWLRSQGRGYQTRINALLREEMLKRMGKKTA